MALNSYTKSYTSFSGVDITAVFDSVPIGTLQGISYSVTREKAPIYTLGSADPRSFSRGKRGIAGSMVFTLFDRSALYQMIHDGAHHYYRHEYEPTALQAGLGTTASFWENYGNIFKANSEVQSGNQGVNTVDTILSPADYLDQIMPFDCTIVAQNEYGLAAWMAILGIEILNEGGGLSVDDITNEEQCTYVCRSKTPWIPWNTSTEKFQLDNQGLPQGPSSIRVLRTPDGTDQIGLSDLQDAYTNRGQGTTEPTPPTP